MKGFSSLVKDLVNKYEVDIFTILEPQCRGDKAINRIKRIGFQTSVRVDAVHYSRRIWVMCIPNKVDIKVVQLSNQFTHSFIQSMDGHFQTYISFVYKSPRCSNRIQLWRDLEGVTKNMEDKWIITGDFNAYISSHEKQGDQLNWQAMK